MPRNDFRSECDRCAALCCVVLAFDRSESFAFDKAAGAPCPHLTPAQRCRLHAELAQHGMGGCRRYECYGAGQRVSQELFAGRSWRDEPSLLEPMADAFRAMRQLQELRLLLQTARRLPLSSEQRSMLGSLECALEPPQGWTVAELERFELGSVSARIMRFLRGLQACLPRERRRLPLALTGSGPGDTP